MLFEEYKITSQIDIHLKMEINWNQYDKHLQEGAKIDINDLKNPNELITKFNLMQEMFFMHYTNYLITKIVIDKAQEYYFEDIDAISLNYTDTSLQKTIDELKKKNIIVNLYIDDFTYDNYVY